MTALTLTVLDIILSCDISVLLNVTFITVRCESSFVKAYIKGQDIQENPESYDYNLCGDTVPSPLVTTYPRLLLVFRAGPFTGTGFKAQYQFVTGKLLTKLVQH